MLALHTEARCKLDYRMMVEPRPSGPTIGYLAETPIAETVIDRFGRHFLFAGVTPHKPNDQYDAELLAPGEFIVSPGLIYRLEKIEKPPQSISPKGVPLSGWRALGARGTELENPHDSGNEFDFILLFWLAVAFLFYLLLLMSNTA